MKIRIRMFVLLMVVMGLPLFAQDASQFVQAQKDNTASLKQYTWKSRTELKLKGESKKISMDQVRYDMDGKLQKTPLGGTPEPQEQQQSGGRRSGRVKQKIVENKKEDFADMMKNLVQLVSSYGSVPPEKWQAFMQKATKEQDNGAVRISGKDLQVPGDTVTIWINPSNAMLRKVDVQTVFDKKPVTVSLDYATLPDGATFQAKTKLTYPSKELEVTIENYDYQKLGS